MINNQILLLRDCEIYSPEYLGLQDVIIGGGKILAFDRHLSRYLVDAKFHTIECNGNRLLPGIIDAHAHIAGAGGEGGPATRTPEMNENDFFSAGITSVIGCLGTDGFTRDPVSVLMKVKKMRQLGLSAWMYTGAYQIPPPTITGDISKDLTIIDEVIGVGEVAISDHRSSHPTTDELIKLARKARVGGMIGGKAGIINIHMGDDLNPFEPLYQAASEGRISLKQFYPTHCNRNPWIFEDAKKYGLQGYVDITTSAYPYFPDDEIKPSRALRLLLEAGVPIEHITFTSDSGGSLPAFDQSGKLVKIETGKPYSILHELRDCILSEGISLDQAWKVSSFNPATLLKLGTKGQIAIGYDADLILLGPDFEPLLVISMGAIRMNYL